MSPSSRRLVSAIGFLLVAGLLTGCSDETDGDPTPPTDSPPANGGAENVPKVVSPLDPGPFLSDPCKLVDQATLSEVGEFEPGEPDVDSDHAKNLLGPGCGWLGKDLGQDISLRIGTPRRDHAEDGFKGMASVYATKASGDYDYFQPMELPGHAGYPAAVAGKADEISAGECPVYVGIADDLTFTVAFVDDNNPANACPAAQKVAGAVLNTLKKGS